MKNKGTFFNRKNLVYSILLMVLFFTGCIQKDEDIFFVNKNYSDNEPVKAVLTNFQNCLNRRDLNSLMNVFDENIDFPDKLDSSLRVTYRNLLYDYKDFFQKTESVNYAFNDQYIILSEHTAKVTMKLQKQYKAIAPFAHTVNTIVDEQVTITKNSSGAWKVTNMNELLPPRIY